MVKYSWISYVNEVIHAFAKPMIQCMSIFASLKNKQTMNSKITSLVIACVLSLTAFAKTPLLSVAPSTTARVYDVYYKGTEAGNVKVSIYDNSNVLVFSETINDVTSFKRPYNFSNLSQGEYTIVLEDKNGKQVENVTYRTNTVNSFIHVSEVANAENKYMLNVTNDGTESVYVKILNSENEVLHEQQLKVTGTFGLIYNLSQVRPSTEVTFEITTSNGKVQRMTF